MNSHAYSRLLEVNNRCVRLNYANEFHMDIHQARVSVGRVRTRRELDADAQEAESATF